LRSFIRWKFLFFSVLSQTTDVIMSFSSEQRNWKKAICRRKSLCTQRIIELARNKLYNSIRWNYEQMESLYYDSMHHTGFPRVQDRLIHLYSNFTSHNRGISSIVRTLRTHASTWEYIMHGHSIVFLFFCWCQYYFYKRNEAKQKNRNGYSSFAASVITQIRKIWFRPTQNSNHKDN
jgi:hypothetical protein